MLKTSATIAGAVIALVGVLAVTAQAQSSTTPAQFGTAGAQKKAATKAPARTAAKKAATTTAKSAPPVRHTYQQQPAQDRYKEIQQALADRGYFKGPVDGNWGPESAEALKQFQREQRIDEDGKINSLSLIALGLGPHREFAANAPNRNASLTNPPVSNTPADPDPAPRPSSPVTDRSGVTAGP